MVDEQMVAGQIIVDKQMVDGEIMVEEKIMIDGQVMVDGHTVNQSSFYLHHVSSNNQALNCAVKSFIKVLL